MNRLDKAALSVIGILLAAVIGVSWIGSLLPLKVMLPQQDGIGPLGPVLVQFSQPVNDAALAGKFSLEPQGILTMEMVSEKVVKLTPAKIIGNDETATLRLAAGTYGVNGETLKADQTWSLRLRPTRVVYLGAGEQARELFSVGLDGSAPQQLTQTEDQIYDFTIVPGGESIVYSVINDQRGIDLWQIDRNGQNARLLLECKRDHCSTPAFSPDGQKLAYTREMAGLSPTDPPGAPRVWVFDRKSGQNRPAFADDQIIGHGPSWSPDGRRLATWDGVAGGIRVLNLDSEKDVLLPTQSGKVGAWSPDSQTMLFTSFDLLGEEYVTAIYQADLNSGKVRKFQDAGKKNPYYGTPVWSPANDQVVFSLRPDENSPAEALWMMEASAAGGSMIGKDEAYTYHFYNWNPWGTALVFQRTQLGGAYKPEIILYDLASGDVKVLAENGGFPMWLP